MRQGVRNQSAALRNPDKLGPNARTQKKKKIDTKRERESACGRGVGEKLKAETKIECKWHEILSNETRA